MLSRGTFVELLAGCALSGLQPAVPANPSPSAEPDPWDLCDPSPALPYDKPIALKMQTLDGPDFDQLWLTAMIGHHEGAITMAQAELAHGQDPDAVHLANLIIKAQQREIAYMSHLLSRPQ